LRASGSPSAPPSKRCPRGPVGSGFLGPPAFSAVYLAPSVLAAEIGGMPLVFGMTLFAGVVEVLVALALNRLRVVITPVLSGLTVFVVGLELGVVGIGETLDGPSLVGVSGATGATSRAIAFAASIVLLVFAFSPKLSGFFLLVPSEVAGSMLVFTASFMISGGMQVMLSRPVDTRAVYVIGVSTLLALSENVFPGYFRNLPASVRSFTSSPLALCLSAAIALTLLFRLGTRQVGEIAWNDLEDSIASAIAFLRNKAQAWKIAAAIIEISAAHTRDVIAYILKNHSRHPEGILRAIYDGVDLRVDIIYRGTRAVHLPVARGDRVPIDTELDNEEAAAYVGLRNFLRGLAVDRHQIMVEKGRVVVRLFYGV
jgi:xanthine permease XanP